MLEARKLIFGAAGALTLILCGCVDVRGSLSSATERLEHNANALAGDAGYAPPATQVPEEDATTTRGAPATADAFARDAHALAQDARDLRHTVEGRYSDTDVKVAFDRVSRSYHAVRDEVEHSDSRTARDDMRPVTDAYVDVEHALNRYDTPPTG